MGIRTAAAVGLGMLSWSAGAGESSSAQDLPEPIVRLVAMLSGASQPGRLHLEGLAGQGGPGSDFGSIRTDDGVPWLTITASNGRSSGGAYQADNLEVWRRDPVFSIANLRISGRSEEIALSGGPIRYGVGVGDLSASVSAEGISASYSEGQALAVRLKSPVGWMSIADKPGRVLTWSADSIAFDGRSEPEARSLIQVIQFSANVGTGIEALRAARVESDVGVDGTWGILIEGLVLSRHLRGRFGLVSDFELPPVAVRMTFEPAPAGRRSYSALISGHDASLTIGGWLEVGGSSGRVTNVKATGVLDFLAAAGSTDPVAVAAGIGLFYDEASQDGDSLRSSSPGWEK